MKYIYRGSYYFSSSGQYNHGKKQAEQVLLTALAKSDLSFDEMTGCLTEDLFLQTPSVPPGQLYLGWGLFPKKLWTVVGDMEQCRFVCPIVWFQTHHV